MPSGQTVPPRTRFVQFVSTHRFWLMMLACGLVFAAELAVVNTLSGFARLGPNHSAAAIP